MSFLFKIFLALLLTIQCATVKSFASEEENTGKPVCESCVSEEATPGQTVTVGGTEWQLTEKRGDGNWNATPIEGISFGNDGSEVGTHPEGVGDNTAIDGSPDGKIGGRIGLGEGTQGQQRLTGKNIEGYEDDANMDKADRLRKEAIRQKIVNHLNAETTADAEATTADLNAQLSDLSKEVTETSKIGYTGTAPTDPFNPLAEGTTGGFFDPLTLAGNGEFYADQAGWPPFDDHEYQSDHKEELNKLRNRLNFHMSKTPQQADAKRAGYFVLNEADKAYVENDAPLGDALKKTAMTLVDIATDIIPLTAIPKDFYRVIIGKEPMTGEVLSNWERALAAGFIIASIITVGGSNVLAPEARAIAKGARLAEAEVASGVKIVESAGKNVPRGWGHWSDLKKVQIANKEYAEVGNLLYKQHAVERMAPNGLIQEGNKIYSRGVPPIVVEHAIKYGTKNLGKYANTIEHVFENVTVITDSTNKIVFTIIKKGH